MSAEQKNAGSTYKLFWLAVTSDSFLSPLMFCVDTKSV